MNKEQEICLLDQIKELVRKQNIQRGFLLLEGQRIVSICREETILPVGFSGTVVQRLEELEELQSEMMELVNNNYSEWDHQNNLHVIKDMVEKRKNDVTKRDRYAQTLKDIKNIVFGSVEHNLNFKTATKELHSLNLDEMNDEECESRLGKYVMLFEALRESSAAKQAEWIVKLSPLFDMGLISNVFTKNFTLQESVEGADEIEEKKKDKDDISPKVSIEENNGNQGVETTDTQYNDKVAEPPQVSIIEQEGESETSTEQERHDGNLDEPLAVYVDENTTTAMADALFKALGLRKTEANEKTLVNKSSEKKKSQIEDADVLESVETNIKEEVKHEGGESVSEHAKRLSDKISDLNLAHLKVLPAQRKEISKKATLLFNLKTFKADMSGEAFSLKKAVLNMAFDFGAVTGQLLTYKENYNPKAVLPEAEGLWRKGYLAKSEFENVGRCYTLSDKGRSILGSKEAAKALGRERVSIEPKNTLEYDRKAVEGLYLSAALQYIEDKGEYFDPEDNPVICDSCLVVVTRKEDERTNVVLNIGTFSKGDPLQFSKEIDRRIKLFGADTGIIRVFSIDRAVCRNLADAITNEYGNIAQYEIVDTAESCSAVNTKEKRNSWQEVILFNDEIEEIKKQALLESEKAKSEIEETGVQEPQQENSIIEETPTDEGTSELTEVTVDVIDFANENNEKTEVAEPDTEIIEEDVDIPEPETYVFKNPESLGRFKALSAEEAEQVSADYVNMLANDLIYCAMAYIRSASKRSERFIEPCKKLAYAVNDPAENCQYDSERIFHIYLGKEESDIDQYLYIAAAIRTLFTSENAYDYSLKQLLDAIRTTEIVSGSNSLSNFLYELYEFKNKYHCGIDKYADYRVSENILRDGKIKKLQERANSLYNAYVIEQRGGTANQRRLEFTKRYIFAKDGTISELLRAVISNSTELLDAVCEYMSELLITDGAEVRKENISNAKIDKLIEDGWNDAAQYMSVARKSSRLMGSLRQNLFQRINEVAAVISDWVYLSKELSETSDEGNDAYSKLRPQLLSDIDDFITEGDERSGLVSSITKETYAGWVVLRDTLLEMQNRIQGQYSETDHKYFYIRFLKNNKVLVDQDYVPEFEIEVPEIEELSMLNRIKAHADEEEKPLREQLSNWCDDNFGTARSIISYLTEVNKEKVEGEDFLEEAIHYAARQTANMKMEFIENLELSQSYGQIDSTSEDRKDRILKIVDDWYAWSESTGNFGFFKCILSGFQKKIKEDAKSREAEIRSELDITLKRGRSINLESDEMKAYIQRIRDAIEAQNYTYAEDMILRLSAGDTGVGIDLLEEDYLKLFWKEFEQNYYATAGASRSLEYKYERFQRENKDTRAARSLITLWLSNGGHMGEERIQKLMNMLGFPVERALEKPRIVEKIENYEITLKKNSNGKKANYKHPIAAFGSGAMQDGIRVVCLYGTYDADRLIEMFREIGDAMNTIVLLDFALNRDQRQRLARKIKKEASNAAFGLIDRVAFMFLVNNYKDATINKMLMSIMMPFSFYQPYIYDSSSVIPPEMFIGRKTELNKIEDPNGANIVYGGRQLGKSALLRMAKAEIDRNENGDRAILVDVKGLDDRKSCIKISQALVDEGILEEGAETEEWSDLSRAIRKRLAQEDNRIPYLLLLIDEADTFVESSERNDYSAFDNLLEVQNVGQKRFKFVIAGLRNVVRFNRDNAISANKSMTKFGALAVRPLAYAEARELLEVPLNYLGLRFPKEKEALVSMIFASANYFPGLIQLYCAKLIEAMTKDDYAGYDQDRTPPYEVVEKHIKKVLADTGFQQQIREKFMITLKIDADDYYYVIALLMAYLYNNFNNDEGYTPEDISEIAVEYGFGKIAKLDVEKIRALMEEMCELNVFHQLTDNHFKFSRYNFYQMMGDKSKVEEEILSYLEGRN